MPNEVKHEQRRLRIGVCGVGSIGSRHTRLLSQRGDVDVCVADTTEQHLRDVEKLPAIVASAATLDELLGFGLDGLIVATPDHLHVPIAEAACRKGVPVLLEKPIADNVENALRLLPVSAETGIKILVGYPLRHHSGFLKAKEILDQGQIGVPVSFHIELGAYETLVVAKNRFTPEDRNKLVVDYSHEWDYLQWFLGKAKRAIAASSLAGNREKKQNPNVVDALIELTTQISGTVHLDYIQSPGKRVFTIIGDEGSLVLDASKKTLVVQRYSDEFERTYVLHETFDSMMNRQLDHFLEVIAADKVCKVTVDDGINALRVADALIKSIETDSWQAVL